MDLAEIQDWADLIIQLLHRPGSQAELSLRLGRPDDLLPQAIEVLLDKMSRTSMPADGMPADGTPVDGTPVDGTWADATVAGRADRPGMERVAAAVLVFLRNRKLGSLDDISTDRVLRSLATLDDRCGESDAVRWHWLSCLLALETPAGTRAFTERLIARPSRHAAGLQLAFGAMLQRTQPPPELFPQLLDALQHPQLAAAILDVANHFTRIGAYPVHPASSRREQLEQLLTALVRRLEQLEPSQVAAADEPQAPEPLGWVDESMGLVVTLCDALGLIGSTESLGKLNQALQLRHRRIQTEAAAAMARLGDERGREALVELAAQPVARLRVLAFAEELELLDSIDEAYCTAAARAEAELASWLADPRRFGIAPAHLELIDCRELWWPGFSEQQTCFLFRFHFVTPVGELMNVGIAGPATHAVRADLTEHAVPDVYALFAGLQAEHELIFETMVDQATADARSLIDDLREIAEALGLSQIQPKWLGQFFDQPYLVSSAMRDDISGTSIVGLQESYWIPQAPESFDALMAYAMFKGRKLLAAFNPDFQAE